MTTQNNETQTEVIEDTPIRYIRAIPFYHPPSMPPIIIIDLEFLKTCPQLEDATIFKKLFGLVEDDEKFCYKLNYDENHNATILKDFHITMEDWNNFIFFLRQSYISDANLNIDYLMNDTNLLSRILDRLNHIMETCIKLGGIPKFEEYYKNFQQKIDHHCYLKNFVEYNPANPREDKFNQYIWACYAPPANQYLFHTTYKPTEGWSATQYMHGRCTWYRKLKNGNESDIDAVYTESEIGDDTEQIVADTDSDMPELESDSEMNDDSDNGSNTNYDYTLTM